MPRTKSAAKRSLTKRTTAPAKRPGALPEWNLADLYSGLDDPAIKRDLDKTDADCVAFEESYKGKLAAPGFRRRAVGGSRAR